MLRAKSMAIMVCRVSVVCAVPRSALSKMYGVTSIFVNTGSMV